MLDPMDANAIGAAASVAGGSAGAPRARGCLASRGGRRGGLGRPASGCGTPKAAAAGSPTGLSRVSSSFAAPAPPLTLSEFQEKLGTLVPTAAKSASRSSSLPTAAVQGAAVPAEVIDVDADDSTTLAGATHEGEATEHPTTVPTPAPIAAEDEATEAAVKKLLDRVAPELQSMVSDLWVQRTSLAAFAAEVQGLKVTRRLGFELTLDEFRTGLASIVCRAQKNEVSDTAAYYELTSLIVQLGPEMGAIMRRGVEEMESLEQFADFAATAGHPMVNVASPKYHTSCVATLLENEARLGCKSYLADGKQREVSARVRHILVDWLVDVAARYRFGAETLHLAVNIFDRYLGDCEIRRNDVQLIGVSALFLASKYEEIYPPDVHDLVGMTAQTYTKDDILRTERALFTKLQFRVTIPSTFAFAQSILAEQDPMPTPLQQHMVAFLLEAMLHTEVYGQHRPSLTASAAVLVARVWCGVPTTAPPQEVIDTVPHIVGAVMRVTRLCSRCPALRNKYATSKLERVSLCPLPIAQLEAALDLRIVDASDPADLSDAPPAAPHQQYAHQQQQQPQQHQPQTWAPYLQQQQQQHHHAMQQQSYYGKPSHYGSNVGPTHNHGGYDPRSSAAPSRYPSVGR